MVSEKESIYSYLAGRDERYEKLQRQVKEYEEKKQKGEDLDAVKKSLDETIDMIQIRHGSNGVVRRQTISYLFKKILEKLVPSHVRYLTYSCMQENGYFQKIRGRKLAKSDNPIKERNKFGNFIEKTTDPEGFIWKEAINQIGLNEEQIRNLKKAKAPVLKLRDKICKEMQNFLKSKKKIMKLSKEIEKVFDRMGSKTFPIQRAKFLLYVDKVKSKKELSVFELWGVKKNGFKITKTVQKDLQDYPIIKRDYDMVIKQKKFLGSKEGYKEDVFEKIPLSKDNVKNDVKEAIHQQVRLSQDSADSKNYEWHNYVYEGLDSSGDSG